VLPNPLKILLCHSLKSHGLHSGAEIVSRSILQQDQQLKHSVKRGICCRTILLLCLGWCQSAL